MSGSLRNLQEWIEAIDYSSYYELLGVPERADEATLQRAFHRFCAAFHPDQHLAEDERTRQQITLIFKRGAEAYRVLKDPRLRARYDLALAQGKPRLDISEQLSPSGAKSLVDLCTTPAGRLYARRAEERLHHSDLAGARAALELALGAEGTNARLQERLEALQQLLQLQGE